jgi:hypothetical protein
LLLTFAHLRQNLKDSGSSNTNKLYATADCAGSLAVMSTNAVAFLLLNQFRNGVSMDKLVEAMEKLKQDLFYAGHDVGFTGDMMDIINHAVSASLCSNAIM